MQRTLSDPVKVCIIKTDDIGTMGLELPFRPCKSLYYENL